MCKSSRDIKGYDKCETQQGNKAKARQTLQYHRGQLLFPEKGRKSCPGVGFEPTTLCSQGERCIFLRNYYMLLTALKLLFIRIMKCSIIAYVHLSFSALCFMLPLLPPVSWLLCPWLNQYQLGINLYSQLEYK